MATKTQGGTFGFHFESPGGTPQLSQVEPRQCDVLPACSDNIV